VELLKKLHTNWIVGSSKYVCEGYTMSNRVDIKIQSKVKYLEANLMRICLSWIQLHPNEAILRYLLNMVHSFLYFFTNYFES
jgi:hypothetical protein